MNLYGLILGLFTLFIIGIGHVIVIKAEYYFSKQVWPVFFVIGLIAVVSSLLVKNLLISGMLGIVSVTFFWSIHEIIEQEERVKKGWFPAHPGKKENVM